MAITRVYSVWVIGGKLAFAVTKDVHFELAGVALATVVGIILNLVFPKSKKAKK